jgi:Ca2+-transporting ATPase
MSAVGLTSAEAHRRLAAGGPNELQRERPPSRWKMLLGELRSPLVLLLLGACVVSAFLREVADAVAIGVIVVVNAAVGFLQEARAERAILAMRAVVAPRARVLRDGRQAVIAAAEVVPGDALVLEAGDVVAADAALLEAHALSTNEAPLTGESAPADKRAGAAAPDAPLAERYDRVFMGTSVAAGTGLAEVSATGMATELGKIAHLLQTASRAETPLQVRLAKVGRALLILCLGLVVVVAALGLLHGERPLEVFMSAVSLAVAAVPEGLPAIVTIALAVGVQRMAGRNVLVRKLPAVETLGSTTVICTDKTGTLTTGVMAVREIWGPDHDLAVATAAACCDAELDPRGRGGTGDPTELAILAAARDRGVARATIEAERPRRAVTPFDPERRRMSILRADGVLYVKGALESVEPLSAGGAAGAAAAGATMAARGLRVLAVARGHGPAERDLELVGLLGIADPPRSEAIEAVAAARAAGIRTVMITGDHPATARAIALEMGIASGDAEAAERVHARATPEDKLTIVRRLVAEGAVVAMTGDGVNDAPALREAHIGIAMGKTGTEVTREASDMVLADDNFASIVAAVREGRGIFDNIRKTLVYLLAGNAGELAVMLGASLAGLPLPLLPLHLLWMNLVTDGLPALALVLDPPEPDVMQRPPRPAREPMLGRNEWTEVALIGLFEGGVALGAFVWALRARGLVEARSLAFATLVFGELFWSLGARSPTRLLWEVGPFTNVRLLAVVAATVLVQIGLYHVPATASLLQVTAPSPAGWGIALGLGLVPVTVVELGKLARRFRARGAAAA